MKEREDLFNYLLSYVTFLQDHPHLLCKSFPLDTQMRNSYKVEFWGFSEVI